MSNTKVINKLRINTEQLASIIEACINAKVNLYIEGPAGCGKTEITKQVCQRLRLPLHSHRLADCEPSDLRGLPVVANMDKDGKPVMKFSRPADIPPTEGKCVWLLDELNRANRSVMNSIMQATDSSKRVGDNQLSPDMVVVACGNPSTDNNYDVGELDLALNNRFLHVVIDYDVETLATYASQKGWDKSVIGFMKITRSNLFTASSTNAGAVCTPRSLERLSSIVPVTQHMSRENALAMFQGCIGAELGTAFYSFRYELRPVEFSELMTPDGKARLDSHCSESGYRSDLIGLTLDSIVETLQGKKTITKDQAEAVQYFLRTIQAEQSAACIAQLAMKCMPVLTHPTIAQDTTLRDRLQRVK